MRDNLAIQDDTDDDLDDEIDHDSVIRPSKIEDLTPFPPCFKERRSVVAQWQRSLRGKGGTWIPGFVR